jgi:hypothetical protein
MDTARTRLRDEIDQFDEPGIGLSLVGVLRAVLPPPARLAMSA